MTANDPPARERVLARRRAGVLLHPSSLPGARAGGALGADAHRFVDWLVDAGCTVWQVLPLGPVGPDRSPYFARSNHAGNPALVDLEALAGDGLLRPEPLRRGRSHAELLALAADSLAVSGGAARADYEAFCAAQRDWLEDYALWVALHEREAGRPWWEWPEPLRDRDPRALERARASLAVAIERVRAGQWFFHRQWSALRAHANDRGVKLFGDLPIYVAPDSVEVWANRALFRLDAAGRPTAVAGVPPDFYSTTGQLWGNPLYAWDAHARTGYRWWLDRLRAQFERYDLLRIDHFRGLAGYWSVPADAATAIDGRWEAAPGDELLTVAGREVEELDLVAEDLGVITPDVEKLRDDWGLPGMRVLQFGFDGGPGNVHALHEWIAGSVGYTGTHDNDTTAGWYATLDEDTRLAVRRYLDCADRDVVAEMVRVVTASVARLAIVPLQDLLNLGSGARMNTPGTSLGNWAWTFEWDALPPELASRCRERNAIYGR